VDEANGDFSDERSAISLINKYPNIIVLQTLSKAFGLAGIRCGFAIAAPDVIQLMNNVNALHNVDSLTSEVASNALNAIDLLDKSISTRPSEGALV
jgi:histidinol-phosphate aminotransferase